MADIIKSINEIEDIFRFIVLKILKLDPEDKANNSRVRFPWGSNLSDGIGSAPDWVRMEDVCFIYALPYDDPYNRLRNKRYIDGGDGNMIAFDEHTDVHSMLFSNYGPNAYECARDIRDGLFRIDITRILKQNNFALVTDVPAIKRVPELFNGEWWNRADINAVFNEFVRRESVMTTIEQISFDVSFSGRTGDISNGATVNNKEES